jgi:hypothetical protein
VSCAAASRKVGGWKTSIPAISASSLTGEARKAMPRPDGRSGCVSTSATSWSGGEMASSACAANSGVPAKISLMP